MEGQRPRTDPTATESTRSKIAPTLGANLVRNQSLRINRVYRALSFMPNAIQLIP